MPTIVADHSTDSRSFLSKTELSMLGNPVIAKQT